MEITGKVVKINKAMSGKSARGEWKKQELIIETEEQYPKQVCLINWNDKVDISSLTPGQKITVGINIESREFNERWFTDVKIWRLDLTDNAPSQQASSGNDTPMPEVPDENDPFGGGFDNEDDGLPF